MTYASIMGPDNIPPLEAFALGCPVICSKYDGSEEQLKDASLFFNPYDEHEIIGCVKKMTDKTFRDQLILDAKKLAEQYCVENYIKVVLNTFDKASKIRECWE